MAPTGRQTHLSLIDGWFHCGVVLDLWVSILRVFGTQHRHSMAMYILRVDRLT